MDKHTQIPPLSQTAVSGSVTVSELRIGNYVKIGIDINLKSFFSTIEEISNMNNVVIVQNKNFIKVMPLNAIEPILITENWLLDFGFEWSIFHQAFHKNNFGFDINSLHGGGFDLTTFKRQVFISKINFVHELQNLYFALTGLELQLVL
jgi:hypothetical protein